VKAFRISSNPWIAAQLKLSEMTVRVHRSHVSKKMEAASVVELAQIANRLGLAAEQS